MKIKIKLFLLLFTSTFLYSMEFQRFDNYNQKTLNVHGVSSLKYLTIQKITSLIEDSSKKLIPFKEMWQKYFDVLPIEDLEILQQDFIYTHGLKQKILDVKILGTHEEGVSRLDENSVVLCSGSHDGTIKVWNKKTENCLGILSGHNNSIFALTLSKKYYKLLYSGAQDNKVKLWNIKDSLCTATLDAHDNVVMSIKEDIAGQKIYTGSYDKTIKIWDIEKLKCLAIFTGHQGVIRGLLEINNQLYSASDDGIIKVWDVRSGKSIHSIKALQSRVCSLIAAKDKPIIISGGADNSIKGWDIRSNNNIITYLGHTNFVSSLCNSKNENRFYSGSRDHSIKVWDVESGQCINTFIEHNRPVWNIVESSNSNQLYSASEDKTIKQYTLDSFEKIYNI